MQSQFHHMGSNNIRKQFHKTKAWTEKIVRPAAASSKRPNALWSIHGRWRKMYLMKIINNFYFSRNSTLELMWSLNWIKKVIQSLLLLINRNIGWVEKNWKTHKNRAKFFCWTTTPTWLDCVLKWIMANLTWVLIQSWCRWENFP